MAQLPEFMGSKSAPNFWGSTPDLTFFKFKRIIKQKQEKEEAVDVKFNRHALTGISFVPLFFPVQAKAKISTDLLEQKKQRNNNQLVPSSSALRVWCDWCQ